MMTKRTFIIKVLRNISIILLNLTILVISIKKMTLIRRMRV